VASKKEIGAKGEIIAQRFLSDKGYEILARNWRYSRAEIDIIAKHKNILIFIEVKTRSYDYFGQPEDAVTAGKEALIMDAAQRYMEKINYDWQIRFDIISIILDKSLNVKVLKHFEDAFFY
jgi:putative endonuclease